MRARMRMRLLVLSRCREHLVKGPLTLRRTLTRMHMVASARRAVRGRAADGGGSQRGRGGRTRISRPLLRPRPRTR